MANRTTKATAGLFCLFIGLNGGCRGGTSSDASTSDPEATPSAEAASPSPGQSAASPPAGTPRTPDQPAEADHWYDFRFKGQKVGYYHTQVATAEREGRPVLHVLQSSLLQVKRLQESVRMESTVQSWAELDGTPLEFVHRRQEGGQVREIRGKRVDQGFEVVTTVGERASSETYPLKPGTLLVSTLEALYFDDLEVGFRKEGMAISETEGDLQPFKLEVMEKKDGRFVVRQVHAGIETQAFVDAEGVVHRVEIPNMGASFEKTTRARAVKLGKSVDLFSAGLFAVPEPLPDRRDLKFLRVRIATRSEGAPPALEDVRQTVVRTGDVPELRLEWAPKPAGKTVLPVEDPELAPYLASTPFEDLEDPRLVAAAKKAVGDAATVWDAAQRINRFVERTIQSKSLARAFNSASEALQSREGDCTEHAVLFSALAKIVGIPVRLATGLVYVGGVRNQFGYHEWVEVWTDGRWHPMDPTFGQVRADPTHIKFSVGLSDADGLRQSGAVAASLIGDLELDVLEYGTQSGRRVKLRE